MKRLICLAIFGFIFISCAYEASAQSIDAKSLRGIKRVQILVEDLSADSGRFITNDEVSRIIRERLTRRGIQVIADSGPDDRYNILYVNLNLLSDDLGVVFNLKLSFEQMVTLRDDYQLMASTWSRQILAKSGQNGARRQIIEVMEELTDQFLLDYLTVNR